MPILKYGNLPPPTTLGPSVKEDTILTIAYLQLIAQIYYNCTDIGQRLSSNIGWRGVPFGTHAPKSERVSGTRPAVEGRADSTGKKA